MNIDTKELNNALKALRRIISKKTTLPILSTVLLKEHCGSLIIEASNLDISARMKIAYEGTKMKPGCLNASRLGSLVASVLSERIDLDDEGDYHVSVSSKGDRFKASLPTLPAEEFPPFLTMAEGGCMTAEFSAGELAACLSYCVLASSDDPSRFVLNGVYLEPSDEGAIFVGTDGRRLHKDVIATKWDGERKSSYSGAILPTAAAQTIMAILDGHDDTDAVTLSLSGGEAQVSVGDVLVAMKLIEGNYPNWRQVVPAKVPDAARVKVKDIESAISRAEMIGAASVLLTLSEGAMQIKATKPDCGEVTQDIDAEWTGSKRALSVNPGFFKTSMDGCEEADVCIKDEMSPFMVLNPSRPDRQATLMPMRTLEAEAAAAEKGEEA